MGNSNLELGFDLATIGVHTARKIDLLDSFCEPIAMTSAYEFQSSEEAYDKFSGKKEGNVYSRFTNPTVRAFEKRVAAMEDCEDAIAFSSGMGAILAICLAFASKESNVVCSQDVFGTTINVFKTYMSKFGVEARFCRAEILNDWENKIDENTSIVILETPSNPLQKIADIRGISLLAKKANAIFVVDNTLLTPVLQRPISLGCDLVLHSAGKYMDGHGRVVLGVVAGRQVLVNELKAVLRTLGLTASPFNAWLVLKGLETLSLRVERATNTAKRLSEWLSQTEWVKEVFYSGLNTHPQHALIARQQLGGGGVFSFDISGSNHGNDVAWHFIDNLRLVGKCTNIGDTRTIVTHPATTTHCKLSKEERIKAGIGNNLIRISVGLESFEDLKNDIEQALKKAVPILAKAHAF